LRSYLNILPSKISPALMVLGVAKATYPADAGSTVVTVPVPPEHT
jgi:hypothetical protein